MLASAGDSCGASDSVQGCPSTLAGGCNQLHCRCMDSDGAESVAIEAWRFPGDTSAGKSADMDGSLDLSLMAGVEQLVTPGSLQRREIDPLLFSTLQIPEDAWAKLARHPEIDSVHKRLGAGSFGEVFRCTMKGSQQEFAVKVLHKGSDISQKREVELLHHLKHNNLVHFHSVLRGSPDAIVLELCAGGSLADVLHGPKAQKAGVASLGLQPRAQAALDVLSAVEYLHTQQIVHRDVKTGNAFLTSLVSMPMVDLPPVKLGDLGLARQVDGHMTQCTGTWRYMAPEVMTSNTYAEPADVFSCGLLLYEALSGKVPFDGVSAQRVVQAVLAGRRPDPRDVAGLQPIVDALAAVMHACWAEEPNDRPSASYLAQCIQPLAART